METRIILEGIFWFSILLMAIGIIFWLVLEWGKKQLALENEYEKKYEMINRIIDSYEVCELNYDGIMLLLENLGQLKWKNHEKTVVLSNKFWLKYSDIRMKRIS